MTTAVSSLDAAGSEHGVAANRRQMSGKLLGSVLINTHQLFVQLGHKRVLWVINSRKNVKFPNTLCCLWQDLRG